MYESDFQTQKTIFDAVDGNYCIEKWFLEILGQNWVGVDGSFKCIENDFKIQKSFQCSGGGPLH